MSSIQHFSNSMSSSIVPITFAKSFFIIQLLEKIKDLNGFRICYFYLFYTMGSVSINCFSLCYFSFLTYSLNSLTMKTFQVKFYLKTILFFSFLDPPFLRSPVWEHDPRVRSLLQLPNNKVLGRRGVLQLPQLVNT